MTRVTLYERCLGAISARQGSDNPNGDITISLAGYSEEAISTAIRLLGEEGYKAQRSNESPKLIIGSSVSARA